ncbi:hypothetical protein Poli38472_009964 [Pythium oligandrum]|uniref:N-acetyltransferase domain-containing protein n=1 Tax=Pythium oligandrum TaxID=41045 RepID=A0A8K1C8H3_PYTOL|nr:hypothetical protein Poli38472_009964 [Pythium oligandrum]|eukprot:TMW58405.1 hypothetical protein Poli38472_009964 [Pythium oligandrum]
MTASQDTRYYSQPLIRVRRFQPEDQDQVVQIFASGMLAYAQVEGQDVRFYRNYVDKTLKTDLGDIEGTYFASGGHFWVATTTVGEQEVVVGMVGLEGKPDGVGEVRRMSVMPEYRRFGVGRDLIDHLERWAEQNGFTKVWLATGRVMVQACRFYESLGYKDAGSGAFSTEYPYIIEVYYEKCLS